MFDKNLFLALCKQYDVELSETATEPMIKGEYRRVNFSKLNFSNDTISYDEALESVTPFDVSVNDIFGQKKVKVTKAEKDYENRCVKLEIFC